GGREEGNRGTGGGGLPRSPAHPFNKGRAQGRRGGRLASSRDPREALARPAARSAGHEALIAAERDDLQHQGWRYEAVDHCCVEERPDRVDVEEVEDCARHSGRTNDAVKGRTIGWLAAQVTLQTKEFLECVGGGAGQD